MHSCELYLIPFLHQTTTRGLSAMSSSGCILFHFYIKPQPSYVNSNTSLRCILFHFYIKPQRVVNSFTRACVVSYSISTSNHNETLVNIHYYKVVSYSILHQTTTFVTLISPECRLYLIPFLHQTTTYGA